MHYYVDMYLKADFHNDGVFVSGLQESFSSNNSIFVARHIRESQTHCRILAVFHTIVSKCKRTQISNVIVAKINHLQVLSA